MAFQYLIFYVGERLPTHSYARSLDFIDDLLEGLLGGISPQINIIASMALLIVGLVVLMFRREKESRRQRTVALILMGIGCIGLLKGVIQLIL